MASVLPAELLKLSPAERIQLAEDLWESIVVEPATLELTDAQRSELERRLARVRDKSAAVVSWDELDAELRAYD